MKIHGKNGEVHINGSQWLYATAYSLDVGREFADVSVLGDLGKVFAGGLREVSGTFAGLYDAAGSNVPMVAVYDDVVAVQIYAASGVLVASGDAWITGGVAGEVTDAVRIRGAIKGTGGWSVT